MDGWMVGWMDGWMDGWAPPPQPTGRRFEFSFTKWLAGPFLWGAVLTHLQCVIYEPAPLGAPGGFMSSPFCLEESWICRIRAVLLLNI